eukprot:TRINITY_DN3211_c0_g1_i13.p1 TRINITY_DN3211_c0_g1~~TRINITY_DN3211_c0_g1_i13.p1  ORF type:complete len:565 (+),score=152.27 TRINITY_DN3211_c0_g1_i13:118-1812(+)
MHVICIINRQYINIQHKVMKTCNAASDEDIYSDYTDSEEEPISAYEVQCRMNAWRPKDSLKIVVNVLNTQYSLVRRIVEEIFCYRTSASLREEWDLLWTDTGITLETFAKMKTYQKINHFPSMNCLSRKDNLGKNLMRMRRYFPEDYDFVPPTWHLPNEYGDFRTQCTQSKGRTYIVKPEAMSQGKGIYLIKSHEELDIGEHCVVQRYVSNPYLIDGLKFDLRLYVLIYGCDPLRLYLYNEGLARLATEEYEQPSRYNMKNVYVHLTNYAINKRSENFVFNTDEDEADTGHKRSLSFVWSYIDSHGGDSKELQQKIKSLIVKTFCAVQPQLAQPYRTSQPNDVENNMCFEILGFDILVDSSLNPWLLEVNHSPSFSTDTPFDYKIKEELIYDTIKLLHLDPSTKVKYKQERDREFKSRALGRTTLKMTKERRKALRDKAMEARDEYELKNLGRYTRIYPDPQLEAKHSNFITIAENLWEEFFGYKKHVTLRVSLKKTSTSNIQRHSLIVEKPRNTKRLTRTSSKVPAKEELPKTVYKERNFQRQTMEDPIEVEDLIFPKAKGIF